ncbi:CDP-glycerol glycerophosphotransferase family protein [Oceanobacillus kimchii]|uniref:CDP-glycerol glycerophosphotransferase family protein n=1 Tax=Oceanobacillus kimchii TaxID=746691 RepID=UPI000984B520|nr:CDP-glycerol glycerophosphotransferase family protein [Oceanobacillus kimchii]
MGISSIKKRIKQRFIKKVIVNDIYVENRYIVLEVNLYNFYLPMKTINIYSSNNNNINFQYKLKGNKKILLWLPISSLKDIQGNLTINMDINGQKMWIKSGKKLKKGRFNYIHEGKYFTIVVNKSILFENKYREYSFSNKTVNVKLDVVNNLNINIDFLSVNFIEPNIEPKLVLLSNKTMKVEDGEFNQELNKLNIKELSLITKGKWKLYLLIRNILYPIEIKKSVEDSIETEKFSIEVVKDDNCTILVAKPRFITNEQVFIKRELGFLSIDFLNDEAFSVENKESKLLLEGKHQNSVIYNPLEVSNSKLNFKISLDDNFYNGSHLKEILLLRNVNGKQLRYSINMKDVVFSRDASAFKEVFNSQYVKTKFYRKKNSHLGLKNTFPKLRKTVESVSNFSIKGELSGLEKFIKCKKYLLLEERNTLDSIKVPIRDRFSISLEQMDLISLKSKDKTVIDFFILLEDIEGNMVRKEKIKYKFSNYKKDNYYSYVKQVDNKGNTHHFLITTTPFNNLKLESFTIPKDIMIPDDTSVKDPNLWLIGERYNTAQDNGFALFNWLQENTEIEAYYVIEGDSEDYLKIKDNPNVLKFGSEEHFNISFKAKVLLGTHDLENLLPYKPAKGFFNYEDTFKVFLQHGVLGRKNVEYHKKYYDIPFDLFIVSSDPEKFDVVVDQLGYNPENVEITGLARFDNLIQKKAPKDILLMPTWRDWINSDEKFLQSAYYQIYTSLINNNRLLELLESFNVNLNFYPHYRAQDFFAKGHVASNSRVNFIQLGSKKVQELLIDHALLITDYSSVSFDFSIMNKPVIYYHFDSTRFFRKGILRQIEETFIGEIANTEEELVDLIESRIVNNFQNYNNDISGIVKYQDHNNCERIFRSVVKRL